MLYRFGEAGGLCVAFSERGELVQLNGGNRADGGGRQAQVRIERLQVSYIVTRWHLPQQQRQRQSRQNVSDGGQAREASEEPQGCTSWRHFWGPTVVE